MRAEARKGVSQGANPPAFPDNRQGPFLESGPRGVGKETCVSFLGTIAPVSDELAALLRLPETLYMPDRGTSFSSDPARDIAGVANSLILGFPMPSDYADYGICISEKGSNAFCTFVDRSRKVMVSMPVRNMYAEAGSWEPFAAALDEVLGRAKTLEENGQKFGFVVSKEFVIGVI
jgi:hypothetical protein